MYSGIPPLQPADPNRHSWTAPLSLLALSLASGVVAFALMADHLAPAPVRHDAVAPQRSLEISASTLFPAPSPGVEVQTVDVYDPPVVVRIAPTIPPAAASTTAQPSPPRPAPAPSPTPTGEPGDNGGPDD